MNCPNNSTLLIYQLYLQPKKEGNMKKQELYNKVIAYFQETIPVAETELHYNNPFELLIAVILSAQCTDKRVNMITPPLYRDFPTPEALAAHSEVPGTLEELIKLPGVGRKTANVIQSVVFNKAAMAVDTHVFRVSHRIGLVPQTCTTPLATEKYLMKYIPKEIVPTAHHWLILHGRYVCMARTPKCSECGLNGLCRYSLKPAL